MINCREAAAMLGAGSSFFPSTLAGGGRCQRHVRGSAEDQQICQEHESNDGAEKRNRVEKGKQLMIIDHC